MASISLNKFHRRTEALESDPTPKLLTVGEAAACSGMSRSWIRNMVRSGELAHVKHGRGWGIDPARLDQLMQKFWRRDDA
jgi:excisionase family DNA binding protein